MKKIVNSKVYDTDHAKMLGSWFMNAKEDPEKQIVRILYRKNDGEFFLYCDGATRDKFAGNINQDRRRIWKVIRPLTDAEAEEWAYEHLDIDAYNEAFGPIAGKSIIEKIYG